MASRDEKLRIGRILGFGVLAEVSTIVLIVIVLTLHSRVIAAGQPQSVIDAFAAKAGAVIGPVAGTLFTFLAAMFATRPLAGRFRTHGVLVGAVGALLTIPGLLAAAGGMRAIYAASMVAKLIAGWLGGLVSERRRGLHIATDQVRASADG
jgi:hypothetical protein